MPSEHNAIEVRGLTKTYRIFQHPGDRLKQAVFFGLRRFHREFTALRDVSLEVRRGETIGIVGLNGAGKSTLLQVICGILKPTAGTVTVEGRISAVLELGAGFNPEFTGRENAVFQGALVGLTEAQMQDRMPAIEAFADIGDFIDQPVRTYSSGMFVRLAFAVATHVDPDILVIDEVLAVGDARFQQKCINHIVRLQNSGTTILLVSHDPYHIERLCHRAGVLAQGVLSPLAPAKEVLALYHAAAQQSLDAPDLPGDAPREGTQEVRFERIVVKGAAGDTIRATEDLWISAEFVAERPICDVHFRFEVFSSTNELVTVVASLGRTEQLRYHGRHRISFRMRPCPLTSGWYYLTAIAGHKVARLDTWQRAATFKVVVEDEHARRLCMDRGVLVATGDWQVTAETLDRACAGG